MKIGILGGSFNPPHKMHMNMGLELLEKGYLDKVIYVPSNNILKKDLIDFSERYHMILKYVSNYNNVYIKDNKYYVCYDESAATGFDGSKTCVKVWDSGASITRFGRYHSCLMIEKGQTLADSMLQ